MIWKEQKGDLLFVGFFPTSILSCKHGGTELFVTLVSIAILNCHLSDDRVEEIRCR